MKRVCLCSLCHYLKNCNLLLNITKHFARGNEENLTKPVECLAM